MWIEFILEFSLSKTNKTLERLNKKVTIQLCNIRELMSLL
jgi:hypothetical protein